MNRKKNLLNGLFLLTVFIITIYYIFHGEDLNQLLHYIKKADVFYWLLSAGCVVIFIVLESVIIHYLMRSIQQKVRLSHCVLYSFIGFFFSCITPSASGGQPAQLYYMTKDGIPPSISTLILMIVTITYKMVLVLIGGIVLLFRPHELIQYLAPVMWLCYLGLALNVIGILFMLLFVFQPSVLHWLLLLLIRILTKLHLLRHPDTYETRLEHAMTQYKDVSLYFQSHKRIVTNVLLITIVQRILFFFITYLTCLSFGMKHTDMVTIVVLQGMIAVAVDMLPLPGGMGVSEKMFLLIFTPLLGIVTLPAMVMSRILGFYTELIVSALMTVAAHYIIMKHQKGKSIL